MGQSLAVAIDIGGTFTDVVALDTATGKTTITKVVSTPGDLSAGFFRGLEGVLGKVGASPRDVVRIIHATTLATNAIAERRGARIGILTTKGFRDVLTIGRYARSNPYDLFFDQETPGFLCERRRIMEVEERLDPNGGVLAALNENDVVQAADCLVHEHGVEAIAVCYLFSYVNPFHEQRTKQLIGERYPGVRVSLSSVINPRFREYERLVITAFDAYVGPMMDEYLQGLGKGLRERQAEAVLQIMQCQGGISSVSMCVEKPVRTILSGPVGGVAGAISIARLAGRQNLVTLDIGGTRCDVAIVREGRPYLSVAGKIGRYPLEQAMLDISSLGGGAASIAWVDTAGGLNVGPQSAGADPGPACCGRGGTEPTVTDAALVLGYLSPEYSGGGETALQPELARQAIEERIVRRLGGMDVVRAAAGIDTIMKNHVANQLRLVSLRKGSQPKDFTLIAFGGAGPMAAGRLMQRMGIREGVIPPNPGVLAAFGLLLADIEHEEVATFSAKAGEADPRQITGVFAKLEDACRQKSKDAGISEAQLRVFRAAEMRNVGRSFELEVPFPEGRGEITKETIQSVVKRYHDEYQRIYQHAAPDTPVEFLALRMVYSQAAPLLALSKAIPGPMATPKTSRRAYFDEYKDFVATPVYERTALVPGQKLTGPTIVEQVDSTTIVYPNQVALVDEWGNLVLTCA